MLSVLTTIMTINHCFEAKLYYDVTNIENGDISVEGTHLSNYFKNKRPFTHISLLLSKQLFHLAD